jgi:hypothetical protein
VALGSVPARAGLARWLGVLALLTGAAVGCEQQAESATELVVVVDSDLSVPTDLDQVRIRATSPDGDAQESSAALGAGEAPLPRSLVLHHAGGPLGPFSVEVTGRRGSATVLVRVAQVTFVRGESLVLPLHLVSACRDERCGERESCGEHGCESVVVDTEQLAPWEGEKPALDAATEQPDDAGTPVREAGTQDAASADAGRDGGGSDARVDASSDGGMCMPEPEQCNQLDDDCDGRIDDGFNLMTDPENCGRCGVGCNEQRREVCCRGVCARSCL